MPELTAREERILVLETMPVRGNAHDDRTLLNLVHDIIVDADETWERRGRAMAAMDKAMGEPPIDWHDTDAVRVAHADYLSML
jgi:hypothetical protein